MAKKTSKFDSFMSKIGLLEIQETPAPEQNETEAAETNLTSETSSIQMESGKIVGMVNSEIKQKIEEELAKENQSNPALQGIDFYEYKKGLSMAQGTTLKDRAEFAFKQASTFSSSPLTPQHLLDTSKVYMSKLQEENNHFQEHVNHLMENEVGQKEKQVNDLQAENEQMQKQIDALQKKQAENIQMINEVSGDVHTMRRNIEQKAANFKVTLETVIKEHEEAIDAVKTLEGLQDSDDQNANS